MNPPPVRWAVRRVGAFALALWLPAALVGLWQLLAGGGGNAYYPSVGQVARALDSEWLGSSIGTQIVPSLESLALGLGCSAVVGIVVGYLIGCYVPARQVLLPVLDCFRSTPALAMVPVAVSVLGIGSSTEVVVIGWVALWPILLSTSDGVGAIDPAHEELAASIGLRGFRRFRLIGLPAASPQIMAGLTISLGLGVTTMVAVEMYSSQRGIGFQLIQAQRNFDIAGSYAGAIAAGIVGYLIACAFVLVERRLLRWHRLQREES